MENNKQQAEVLIMKMITGGWISKLIYIASELGIADILTNGDEQIEIIAEKTKADTSYLYRVMRALSSIGIFIERENKVFKLTELGKYLTSEKYRYISMMFNSEWHNHLWDKLIEVVRFKKSAFHSALGSNCNDWLSSHPIESSILNKANSIKIKGWYHIIKNCYDFSQFNYLIDIGGGIGSLMIELLNDNQNLKGFVADLPHVINEAKSYIKNMNLSDRCDTLICDFFKEVPINYDGYILSNILHDWDDDKCKLILNNCYYSMKKNSRLLILEMIIESMNEQSIAPIMDIEVLLMSEGKERTKEEFEKLLNPIGFSQINYIKTASNIYIIECIK